MDDHSSVSNSTDEPLIAKITGFLVSIDLEVGVATSLEDTFLPGISVQNGIMMIDEMRLLYPGDLLHEAGHLAMLPPSLRNSAGGNMGNDGGFEMAAVAWSYAAAIHLGIPASVVFHNAGYRGGSEALLQNFAAGRYIGVSLLEWAGLTATGGRAKAQGVDPYPSMLSWLREEL
jgi:hypothetical protein